MSTSEGEFWEEQSNGRDAKPIDVRLSVCPGDTVECAPSASEQTRIRQSFCLGRDDTPDCQQIATTDGEYRSYSPCSECPCTIFRTGDCIATLEENRDGRLVYSVTLPDRSGLPALVDELRDTGATVSVERILAIGKETDDPPVLTEKQRSALTCALETGYYDRPRKATLDDLAAELGISPSAVSQRLNAVNRRLIKKYCQQSELDRRE
ncbi:helix-turn-helix domain-containing protein [Haloferax sp. YSMS24]|uniref:helix-turn-helix domain-containing protein n=1 Tax=unclassified Haloferax TaxID=2625095 RepID=UPI00398CF56A